jgi:hypothetical protein
MARGSTITDSGGVTSPEREPDPVPEVDGPRVLKDADVKAERRSRVPRERQHPALYGRPGVEVAERTADTDTESADEFVKDFVTLKRDYDNEKDAVHARNVNAVRQYMVNLGLRPGADVEFEGEHEHWDGVSVILRYRVPAVPAVVATQFDQAHTVIPQTGETATQRAQHDAERVDRLRIGHDARRAGTPEAERPKAEARRSSKNEKESGEK